MEMKEYIKDLITELILIRKSPQPLFAKEGQLFLPLEKGGQEGFYNLMLLF
ncbi:MAG: hypothetical protein M0Z67_13985 [Nitrospiraceae bacterium]|nr:hypothetical protein [Nitrospiraceae bacterium]